MPNDDGNRALLLSNIIRTAPVIRDPIFDVMAVLTGDRDHDYDFSASCDALGLSGGFIPCPARLPNGERCGKSDTLADIVFGLWGNHNWSREEIAKWVAKLEDGKL